MNDHRCFVGSLFAREFLEPLEVFTQSLEVVLDMGQQLLDGVQFAVLLTGLVTDDPVEVTFLLDEASKVILWTAFCFFVV